MTEVVLYDHPLSGNCLKVQMFLTILGVSYRTEFVDLAKGASRADWFLQLNPLGQVPVIRDGDTIVRDSQAILTYLALKHDPSWFGSDPAESGAIAEWLSFAAKEVSNGPQMARLYYYHLPGEQIDIDRTTKQSVEVLSLLEQALTGQDWLVAARPTIADIAVFPYIGLIHEAHLDLADYPQVKAWIRRITNLPGYVAMRGLPGYQPRDGEDLPQPA